jgi:glycogen(starch) synthase
LGGVEVHATHFLQALSKRGFDFLVISTQNDRSLPPESDFQGIPVFRFPFNTALANHDPQQLLTTRKCVAELKRQFAPDLIHINCFGSSVFFHLETATSYPSRLLVTLRGERFPPPDQPNTLLERTLRSADFVTAPSVRTIEYARQLLPDFPLPSYHIYNGMDIPGLDPQPLPTDLPKLLCLGRLVPNKGFDLAITGFASISEQFPQARLVIAGEGPERAKLENQSGQLGIKEKIDFIGAVESKQVPELINMATIVVIPSRGWEALPLVALEAGLMCRPVVAARDGGLPEVVIHGETGMLVDKEDSHGLAHAVSFLLSHPHEADQMGKAARNRVQTDFSMDRCVDEYESLCQNLINQTAHLR